MSPKTKRLATAALLTAIAALLSILSRMVSNIILPVPFLRFSLAPVVIIFAGALLGWGWGAFIGAVTDLLTFMYSPGFYFPMFTVTMALYGVFGAFFFGKTHNVTRVILGTLLIQTLLSAFLNTLWNTLLYGQMDAAKLTMRLITSYTACTVYIIVLAALFKVKDKLGFNQALIN